MKKAIEVSMTFTMKPLTDYECSQFHKPEGTHAVCDPDGLCIGWVKDPDEFEKTVDTFFEDIGVYNINMADANPED
jgi:hypothetical protein